MILCIATNLDDYLRVHSFLDESLGLEQQLAGKQHASCGAISDLGILGPGDINEDLSSRVHNIEQAHDLGTVVADSYLQS